MNSIPFERIGGETIVLYADLRERLETFEAMRCVASLPGEFTSKIVKGMVYHYFQATLSSGRAQIYIGKDSDELRRFIKEQRSERTMVLADEKLFQRLGSQIIAGGVTPVPNEMARIIHRLADGGLFMVGGVLVGSIAFHILGTHFGALWENASRTTQDVDLAGEANVKVAVPDIQADIPAVIDSLKMGFFPVPRLSHKEPSTSYAIRGKTLRIDILTPGKNADSGPVFIRRFNAAAQPLKYLDYLIENPLTAVMVHGNPCLVKVPQPARFALHKLIVSQERGPASADKKRKDIAQACALLALLKEDRPGDIETAKADIEKKGISWQKKLVAACREGKIEI
jgi:hypothetical protein